MTEYIINETLYASDFSSSAGSCWGNNFTYDFKIDTLGNIYVLAGSAPHTDPQPKPTTEIFSIIDNIPIPEYIIELFKYLIKTHCVTPHRMGNMACRYEKMQMFFDTVKYLKKSVEKNLQQNIIEKIRYITSNQLEIANQKIINIQTNHAITQKKYEELIKENIELYECIKKLRQEKQEKQEKLRQKQEKQEKKSDSNHITSLYNSWSNPGGSNIYTKSNAQNRMVYNESTNIYEPLDNEI